MHPGFVIALVAASMLLMQGQSQAAQPKTMVTPVTDAAKIAEKAMRDGDDAVRAQATWLNDHGAPAAAAAMFAYLRGDIPAVAVIVAANADTIKLS